MNEKPSWNAPTTTQDKSVKESLGAKKDAIVGEARQAAGHLAEQALNQVEGRISAKKGIAAETIGNVASALRQTGGQLEGVGPLPDLAEQAAGGIERVADYFETRTVAGMIRDVESFARREPALFLGAAFTVGLIGGRFLKSSAPPVTEDELGFESDGTYEQLGYLPRSSPPPDARFERSTPAPMPTPLVAPMPSPMASPPRPQASSKPTSFDGSITDRMGTMGTPTASSDTFNASTVSAKPPTTEAPTTKTTSSNGDTSRTATDSTRSPTGRL